MRKISFKLRREYFVLTQEYKKSSNQYYDLYDEMVEKSEVTIDDVQKLANFKIEVIKISDELFILQKQMFKPNYDNYHKNYVDDFKLSFKDKLKIQNK